LSLTFEFKFHICELLNTTSILLINFALHQQSLGNEKVKLKRLVILPLIALIFSTINVLPAFAALGDDWEATASGLRENTPYWRLNKVSSDGSIQVAADNDIYISTNFGNSWTKKFTPDEPQTLQDFEMSQDGSTIVALTINFSRANESIFFVSTDFGDTWTEKSAFRAGFGFTDFAMSGDGTKIVAVSNQGIGDGVGRFYYSLNSGDTWSESSSTPTDLCSVDSSWRLCFYRPETGHLHEQWTAIDMSTDGQKVVVAGGQTGIKVTEDLGETWSFVTPGDNQVYWQKASFINNNSSILAQTADWDGANGTIKIFTDASTSSAGTTLGDPILWSTFAASADGMKIYAVGRTGDNRDERNVYVSTDQGITWNLTDLPQGRYWKISTDSSGTYAVATTYLNQIYVSNDSGLTWSTKSTGLVPATYNWYDLESSSSGQYLYTIRDGEKLFKSSDYGVTWSDINAPNFGMYSKSSLGVSADGSKIVYPSTITEETFFNCFIEQTLQGQDCWPKLSISNDYGQSWNSAVVEGPFFINSLAISSNGQTQILTTIGGDYLAERFIYEIFVSRDSGLTWASKKVLEYRGNNGSVSISGDGQKLIATIDGGLTFFVSTDFGDTWIEKSLTEEMVQFRYEVPNISISTDGSKVYALTDSGLYLSTDFGDNWQLTNAPDSANINDIKLSPDGSKIVLSYDYSVQYSEDSGQTFSEINSGQEYYRRAVAASQDFSTVAFASSQDVYVSHTDTFVPNPSTPAANNDNGSSTPTPTSTPTVKPKVEDLKDLIEKIKETQPEEVAEVLKPGTITQAQPLIMRLIEDLPAILKPQIVNIFTEEPVANQVLDIKKALDFLKDIVDKVVVDLPSLVRIGGEIQASRLVVVDNTTMQLVTADGGVLSVQANDGENPIPVDQSGKVQMVRSNGVETKGVGLSPNSEFSVYLFSDPTLLGIGKADAQGSFNASFLVDKDFPLGNHTLQINGVLANGKTSSISMPVSVVESVETATTQAMTKAVAEVKTTNSNSYIVFLLIMLALIGSIIVFKGPRFIYEQFKQRIE
jgi:photosystem II stability/assembly factor-like uncharacterized protein